MFLPSLITLFSIAASTTGAPVTSSPYPGSLNTTTPSGFEIRVYSTANPLLNNRNIQLLESDGKQLAVIDPWSPVLLLEMRDGVLYSENRTDDGILYDLGPVAHLQNLTTTKTSSLQEFYFANQTASTPATTDFELINVSNDAEYNLYHHINRDFVVNGFCACRRSGYYQLLYYTYVGEIPNFGPECEYVAVQVSSPEV